MVCDSWVLEPATLKRHLQRCCVHRKLQSSSVSNLNFVSTTCEVAHSKENYGTINELLSPHHNHWNSYRCFFLSSLQYASRIDLEIDNPTLGQLRRTSLESLISKQIWGDLRVQYGIKYYRDGQGIYGGSQQDTSSLRLLEVGDSYNYRKGAPNSNNLSADKRKSSQLFILLNNCSFTCRKEFIALSSVPAKTSNLSSFIY